MSNKSNLKEELLATTIRGNTIETLHNGWVCILNKNKEVAYKKGNITDDTYLRSVAKPIQAIAVLENEISLIRKELAIICASHSGSNKHRTILKKIIKKYDIKLSDLQCGIHMPTDDTERNYLIKHNIKADPLHNNCSGKHVGMLAVCKKNNWGLKNYLSINHPIQKINLKNIQQLSETKKIKIGIDGCSVPTFALPIINIARLFSNFSQENNKIYKEIISSMCENPFYAGGKDQIDTLIMEASGGKLLSKVGGGGLIIVVYNGNILVVKIADGNSQIRSFVTISLLTKLKWLKRNEIQNPALSKIYKGEITNHSGKIVGKIALAFDF